VSLRAIPSIRHELSRRNGVRRTVDRIMLSSWMACEMRPSRRLQRSAHSPPPDAACRAARQQVRYDHTNPHTHCQRTGSRGTGSCRPAGGGTERNAERCMGIVRRPDQPKFLWNASDSETICRLRQKLLDLRCAREPVLDMRQRLSDGLHYYLFERCTRL
jgi:hypothetical protein